MICNLGDPTSLRHPVLAAGVCGNVSSCECFPKAHPFLCIAFEDNSCGDPFMWLDQSRRARPRCQHLLNVPLPLGLLCNVPLPLGLLRLRTSLRGNLMVVCQVLVYSYLFFLCCSCGRDCCCCGGCYICECLDVVIT